MAKIVADHAELIERKWHEHFGRIPAFPGEQHAGGIVGRTDLGFEGSRLKGSAIGRECVAGARAVSSEAVAGSQKEIALKQENGGQTRFPWIGKGSSSAIGGSSAERLHVGPAYRADIDGLRAVAVISVVAFHATPKYIPGGFIGVDIFFVISGYLISTLIFDSLDRGDFRFAEFYVRRVKRIFPSLLVVLVTCLLVGWFTLLPEDYARLGSSIAGSAAFVQNFVMWAETGYFDSIAEVKPLLHIWSLGIEEQFYLLWPLALWGMKRNALNRLVCIGLVIVVSFSWNVYCSLKGGSGAFFFPQTRFWELAAGAAAALAGLRGAFLDKPWPIPFIGARLRRPNQAQGGRIIRNLLSIFGLIFLALGLAFITRDVVFPGFWALVPVAGALALILAGPDAWANRNILSRRVFVGIGLISYPLYLWHWPLLSFGQIINGGPLRPDTLGPLVLAALVLAYLSYRFVEKPVRFGSGRGTVKALGAILAMGAVGVAGYGVYAAGGLANRFPPLIAGIIKKPDLDYRFFNTKRECHLFAGAKSTTFCEESQRPLVFVMGDSHADTLRFGLDRLQSEYLFGVDFAVGCANAPYFVEGAYGNEKVCDPSLVRQKFNFYTLEQIRRVKPAIVILHARWAYDLYITRKEQAVEKLREMALLIKKASATSRIVILGPVPEWRTRPATEIYKAWLISLDKTAVPSRLKSGFRTDIRQWDEYFQDQAPQLGASYISAYKIFCNDDGCLARVGDSASDVTASDSNHLSPAGSIFLLEKIRPELFALFREKPLLRVRPGK